MYFTSAKHFLISDEPELNALLYILSNIRERYLGDVIVDIGKKPGFLCDSNTE